MMSFLDWLKIVPEKNKIKVGEVRPEIIEDGEMAAGSPSCASRKLAKIMEQKEATAKILVICDGIFSEKITDYAVKMGQSLDFEIVALNIFNSKETQKLNPGHEKFDHLSKQVERGINSFKEKASVCGVKFYQVSKIGPQDEVIEQVINEFPGIRYVLSAPKVEEQTVNAGKLEFPEISTSFIKG